MGPYCEFCGRRCFVYFPHGTPTEILDAYKGATIIATCRGGRLFERLAIGYCYDDILAAIEKPEFPHGEFDNGKHWVEPETNGELRQVTDELSISAE